MLLHSHLVVLPALHPNKHEGPSLQILGDGPERQVSFLVLEGLIS